MEVQQLQAPHEPGLQQQHMQQPPARTGAHLLPSQQVDGAQKQHTQASQHSQPPAEPGQQKQEAGGDEQPKKRRRRRKGVVGDINVALYIKQQQSRGSSRKWRQEWVSVRTIIGGGEVKMLKWVTDTPPAAPTTSVAGFANFQGFAQSRPRKPAATTGEGKDTSPAGAERQQQGKQGGALSRLGSTASLDQATAGAQQQQPPKKKSKKQQQQQQQPPGAEGSAVAGPASTAAAAGAAAGAATTPPGTDVYLPLPHPKRKRTTARRPAAWFKTCGEFPPAEPVTVAAASASTGGRAALPAAGSAGGAAGPGQDIKSLAASIAASIAADVHADTSGSPAVTAAGPGPGPTAAGAGKGSKKRKSAAAAAAAAGPGGGTDAAGEGGGAAGAPAAAAAAAVPVMVGPPGAQRFACSVCGRDFATQGALRIHSNVHATKNFACTFPGCKKAFADAKKLEKHAKKHAAAAAVLADTAAAAAATGSGASGAAAASASEA